MASARRCSLVAAATVVLALLAPAGAGAVSFSGPTHYPVGSQARGLAIGDLNRDSRPDVAVAHVIPASVAVFLGNGDGTFPPATDATAAGVPQNVAIGDLDADSNLDFAVAESFPGIISTMLGNGDGTFGAPANVGLGGNPGSIAFGDFNGDSDADLVVGKPNSTNVTILLGNGDGTLAPATTFPAGMTLNTIAVGDFDGDSDQDLAVGGSTGLAVLLGNGDGTFAAPMNLSANFVRSVAIGQFNGDADPDLAVANAALDSVSIWLGSTGGSFSGATDFATGDTPNSVAVGEFNGDADPDLAVSNQLSDNVSVLLGSTGGSFTAPTNFPAGDGPFSVGVSDFNGDGGQDLAVSNLTSNDMSILLARGETALTASTPPTATLGDQVQGSARLAGGFSPNGTITFSVYGPDDPTCAGQPAFSDTVSVSGNGEYMSGGFAPIALGAYRWTASYSGDANNAASSTSCGDAGAAVSVVARPASPGPPVGAPPGPPVVGECANPVSGLRGRSLGPATLGRTRTAQRAVFKGARLRARRKIDRYCAAGGGSFRVGYPTAKLLRKMSPSKRARIRRRAVLILVASPRLVLRGIRYGDSAAAARRRLSGELSIKVGRNRWIVAPTRRAWLLVKTQNGTVKEVGIADRRLAASTASARRFLTAW